MTWSRDLPSWGSALSRALELRLRPSGLPVGSASHEVLAPSNTTTSGAPLRGELPSGRPSGTRISQILAGSALRVLAPLDGFGRAPRVATFQDGLRRLAPSRPVKPPTLRGLVSCRSRPWSYAPPELSLPGEPCPLSQASCFLAGSLSDCPRRSACRSFAAAFLVRASPFEPGRRIPAVASPVASTRLSANRTFRPLPTSTGLAV